MSTPHPHWTEIGDTPHSWERDALDYLRDHLPHYDPFRGFALFEFVADDGSINEVDALVIGRGRIYLVEIKSWPGSVSGDTRDWFNDRGDGRRPRVYENPLLIADRKCKRLASLLARQPATRRAHARLPFVQPLIFLSHPTIVNRLPGVAAQHVYRRDETVDGEPRPGIIGALTAEETRRPIDHPALAAILRALDEAGIRPSRRRRTVGDYELGERIGEDRVSGLGSDTRLARRASQSTNLRDGARCAIRGSRRRRTGREARVRAHRSPEASRHRQPTPLHDHRLGPSPHLRTRPRWATAGRLPGGARRRTRPGSPSRARPPARGDDRLCPPALNRPPCPGSTEHRGRRPRVGTPPPARPRLARRLPDRRHHWAHARRDLAPRPAPGRADVHVPRTGGARRRGRSRRGRGHLLVRRGRVPRPYGRAASGHAARARRAFAAWPPWRGDRGPEGLELLIQYCTSGDRARRPASMTEAAHELASAEAAPAFFDGPQGAQRLPPLAARLATDFSTEARFDNPRAVQLRLPGFDRAALHEVGVRVRDLYADGADAPERVRRLVDDSAIDRLARAVTGELGGRVGVAPRVFLKKLVGRAERVEEFALRPRPVRRSRTRPTRTRRSCGRRPRRHPARPVSSTELLHPALQYHVVNTFGWPSLRPL